MRTETAKTNESPGRAAARTFAGIAVAFSILSAVVLMSQPADARQLCLLHEAAAKQLAQQYEESVVGRGIATNGKTMVELFASDKGGWTLVVTDTEGRSCVIGSGVAWTDIATLNGDPA